MSEDRKQGSQVFPSTCWSQIQAGSSGDLTAAMDALAQNYHRPIESYLATALKRAPEDARDLAQDFFVWMIETDFLAKADPARGRFRAFLKVALRHYVADHDRKRWARKRGGVRATVDLDADDAGVADLADAGAKAPDEVLDQAWRKTLLERALTSVESELARDGREVVFAVFRDYFLDAAEAIDYRAVAARHGLTAIDVSNHLARAKKLYRAHLQALVRETVQTAADLEEELVWLFGR